MIPASSTIALTAVAAAMWVHGAPVAPGDAVGPDDAETASTEAPPPSSGTQEREREPDARDREPEPHEDAPEDPARERARLSFRDANGYFEKAEYREALSRYRETVKLWDHPAVHFNMTVCLIHLDEPVEAYAHIRQVLGSDTSTLPPEFREQAQTYEMLLSAQLAELEVTCTQPEVDVRLDGKPLLQCPGEHHGFVLPGEHQLVASGPGLTTSARAVDLRAGSRTSEVIALEPVAPPATPEIVFERQWKPWVPWAPLAAGVLAIGAGAGLRLLAVRNAEQYDEEFSRICPEGCVRDEVPESLQQVSARARVQNGVAIGLFAAGGAAVASGAVLLILNRPRAVERPVELSVGRGVWISGRF